MLNCFESMDKELFRIFGWCKMSVRIPHASAIGSWLVAVPNYGAYFRQPFCIIRSSPNYSSLLHDPSCPLHRPHPPPVLTLCPFSMPLWNLTNVKPRKTYPRTHSFPAFNRAVPQRLSSPSFESKSQLSINPRIETMDLPNGSSRP